MKRLLYIIYLRVRSRWPYWDLGGVKDTLTPINFGGAMTPVIPPYWIPPCCYFMLVLLCTMWHALNHYLTLPSAPVCLWLRMTKFMKTSTVWVCRFWFQCPPGYYETSTAMESCQHHHQHIHTVTNSISSPIITRRQATWCTIQSDDL